MKSYFDFMWSVPHLPGRLVTQFTNTCALAVTVDYRHLFEIQEAVGCSRKWLIQVWCCHFMLASEVWLGIYISALRADWSTRRHNERKHQHTGPCIHRCGQRQLSTSVICEGFWMLLTISNEKIDAPQANSEVTQEDGQLNTHTDTDKNGAATHTHPTTCTLWADAETAAWRIAGYTLPFSCTLTHGQMCPLRAIIRILFHQSHFNTCNH